MVQPSYDPRGSHLVRRGPDGSGRDLFIFRPLSYGRLQPIPHSAMGQVTGEGWAGQAKVDEAKWFKGDTPTAKWQKFKSQQQEALSSRLFPDPSTQRVLENPRPKTHRLRDYQDKIALEFFNPFSPSQVASTKFQSRFKSAPLREISLSDKQVGTAGSMLIMKQSKSLTAQENSQKTQKLRFKPTGKVSLGQTVEALVTPRQPLNFFTLPSQSLSAMDSAGKPAPKKLQFLPEGPRSPKTYAEN